MAPELVALPCQDYRISWQYTRNTYLERAKALAMIFPVRRQLWHAIVWLFT